MYPMSLRSLMVFSACFCILTLGNKEAQSAYVWTNVVPADGSSGDSTSENLGALLTWGSGDAPITSANYVVSVLNQSGVTVTYNSTNITISGSQVTFQGTVSFDPALNSGTKYTIEFRAMDANMNVIAETSTVTVS